MSKDFQLIIGSPIDYEYLVVYIEVNGEDIGLVHMENGKDKMEFEFFKIEEKLSIDLNSLIEALIEAKKELLKWNYFSKFSCYGLCLFFVMTFMNGYLYQKTNLQTIKFIFSHLTLILSCPLYLLDKTYPFYAQGSVWFVIGLTILNLLMQAVFLYCNLKVVKSIRSANKENYR